MGLRCNSGQNGIWCTSQGSVQWHPAKGSWYCVARSFEKYGGGAVASLSCHFRGRGPGQRGGGPWEGDGRGQNWAEVVLSGIYRGRGGSKPEAVGQGLWRVKKRGASVGRALIFVLAQPFDHLTSTCGISVSKALAAIYLSCIVPLYKY